jgi:MoxR-like ATPase
MSLRRLIQDRELELLDGTKLLRHDRYDSLLDELKKSNQLNKLDSLKIRRIHPSFRIVATAEPPSPGKLSLKELEEDKKKISQQQQVNRTNTNNNEWLNSEVLNLFLYQIVEPLEIKYEHDILSKKFKLSSKHEQLLNLMENLKQSGSQEAQLNHVSKLFSLRKLIRISNKLEKYPALNLRQLIENACLYKFMPQLNRQILNDFLNENNIIISSEEKKSDQLPIDDLIQKYDKHLKTNPDEPQSLPLSELFKIPDTIYYENRMHTIILNNLIRDFDLGEHLLLIGNQGTGKNKLVDKFLMLKKKPREYIQLHRDTTVHSLTVQPCIKEGKIHYEDSPLVKAAREGRVLVVDEADKAPLHVTSIFKSLIETGEMILSDGRRIVTHSSNENSEKYIKMHPDFRMIILANRPGFPFLGNDFYAVLGDLLSCHPVNNPDPQSEIEMLRKYAPNNVSEEVLNKLVNAFGALRDLSDQGLINYPYSTRELVNIVKHLEKFPHDSLSNVLANVYDFDSFGLDQSNDLLKNTFKEVMNKHGIPVGRSGPFKISLAPLIKLPEIVKSKKISIERIKPDSNQNFSASLFNLEWQAEKSSSPKRNEIKVEKQEQRVDSFSELKTSWFFSNKKQNIITDMAVSTSASNNNEDLVYFSTIKPITVSQFNTETNKCVDFDMSEFFTGAWRSYFPRIKLYVLDKNEPDSVLIHEETSNSLFKIAFSTGQVFKLSKSLAQTTGSLNSGKIFESAKKAINRYFVDQNHASKILPLNSASACFLAFQSNTDQISLLDFVHNIELNLSLDNLHFKNLSKIRINNAAYLGEGNLILSVYDASKMQNIESLSTSDLNYLLLKIPQTNNLDNIIKQSDLNAIDLNEWFSVYQLAKSLFNKSDDLFLSQMHVKNLNNADHSSFNKVFKVRFLKELFIPKIMSLKHVYLQND